MPARRYPWFKLWPEALRHEKVVLLSDSAFRTWVAAMAAGSEQSRRGRFASVRHVVAVTGRPEGDIHELVAARLLDIGEPSGEIFVHDWRDWQEKYPSDFKPKEHRNGSAMAPRTLPPEVRGKSTEEEGEGDPSPQPPPREGEPALTAATDDDTALWERARAALTEGWLPTNVEKVRAFELLGRGPDGALLLRAPPWAGAVVSPYQVRAALLEAGDAAGAHAQIVTG